MEVPPIFNRVLFPMFRSRVVQGNVPRGSKKENEDQKEVASYTMRIVLYPPLQVESSSYSQPDCQVRENQSQC